MSWAPLLAAFSAGVACTAGAWALAPQPWRDPLQVAPAHDSVRFENERIRVLEGVDQPGENIGSTETRALFIEFKQPR